MKRIAYFILVFLVSVSTVGITFAQTTTEAPKGTWSLTLDVPWVRNMGHDVKNTELWIKVNGEQTDHLYVAAGKVIKGRTNLSPYKYPTVEEQKSQKRVYKRRPSYLHFFTKRSWGHKNKKHDDYHTSWDLSFYDVWFKDRTFNWLPNGAPVIYICDSELRIRLLPTDISFYDKENELITEAQEMADVDPIVIKATSGYDTSTYTWQHITSIYQWEYSTSIDGTWRDLPLSVQGKGVFALKGTDFYPALFSEADFLSMVENGTISVRIKTPTEEIHKPLSLLPRISAPHIIDAKGIQETICDKGDAKVILKFDRALYPGEHLAIKAGDRISEDSYKDITFLPGDSITIEKLKAGTYTFSVGGTYNKISLYTGAEGHSREVKIEKRKEVKHSIEVGEVHCNGGRDGWMMIKAEGGTGKFKAKLSREDGSSPVMEIPAGERNFTAADILFSGLTAGKYIVEVSDENGGKSVNNKDSRGDNVVTIVKEPAGEVKISVDRVEPKGAESFDGTVALSITGGTPTSQGGYVTIFSHSSGQRYVPENPYNDNGAVVYVFKGLGPGNYSVEVKDGNYALVDPRYPVTPCGCEAALTFNLGSPPPITLTVEQTRLVGWHGGNQGELTAHVKGGKLINPLAPYDYAWFRNDEGTMRQLSLPSDSVARNLVAGTYEVKVTDANGVSKRSAPFLVTEPDPITVQFSVTGTDCSGANTGAVEALVSGGVPPYRYQWNVEGASEARLTGLEAGSYVLKATDSRGGYVEENVEVGSSSDLEVVAVVSQPNCRNLGAVKLKLSGAAPPYTLRWDDVADAVNLAADTEYTRGDLEPGTYRVEITDAKGCRSTRTFEIEQPRMIEVTLGSDLVMCRNQTRRIEAVSDEPNLTYEWSLHGVALPADGRTIVVGKAGEWGVRVVNPDGCSASASINVRFTGEPLDLDMTVPTKVEVSTAVHAVNLSTVVADRIEWKLPPEARVIESSDTRLVFKFDKVGTYKVSMEGFRGEGASIVTREIEVVGKGGVTLPKGALIKQFRATPNPTTGSFRVVVELDRADDFRMLFYSPSGALMDTKSEQGVQQKSFDYEIAGSGQGTYTLHLETGSDKSVLRVVVKK